MKTQIVYILVCGKDDSYVVLQELSLYTLKKMLKGDSERAVLTLMDSSTLENLKRRGSSILSDSTPVVVDIPPEYNQMQISRYLKTSLPEIVHGDFLFLDGDTLIADRLDAIDDMDSKIDIAAVTDGNGAYTVRDFVTLAQRCRKAGFDRLDDEPCFNSGVLFVRDTPTAHEFFKTWHHCWKQSCSNEVPFDQPALWETNRITGHRLQSLPGEWNCQFASRERNYSRYVANAKILHYYKTFYGGRLLLSIIRRMTVSKGKPNCVDAMLLSWPKSIVYLRNVALFVWNMKARFRKAKV